MSDVRPVGRDRVPYTSEDDDSTRWAEFVFRDGDIVISTRSKSGTTWIQMICALVVFQTPDLPAPLSELSRHPLDAAVSGYHQGANIDRERLRSLTGGPPPTGSVAPRPPLREWLLAWVDKDVTPQQELDSLPGMRPTCGARGRCGPNRTSCSCTTTICSST